MSYIYERTINYYETDKMGVVHHSNYARFLEEARCYFLQSLDMPYEAFENAELGIPVIQLDCHYKSPLTFGDVVEINVSIPTYTGVKLIVDYTLTNKKTGQLVMNARTKHCFTDNNLKPVNLKKVYPEFHGKYEKIKEANN